MQAQVLSSFYYGYITTTLLGGVLALRFGGKVTSRLYQSVCLSVSRLAFVTERCS